MKRRAALVLLAAVIIALLIAAPALAAAGGGSSGFGGGGGGGGRGAGLYLLFQLLIRLAIFGHGLGALIIIAAIIAYALFATVGPKARGAYGARQQSGRRHRRQVTERERRVSAAAAEAAEDDPAFAPDRVKAAARRLFEDIQTAWSADDRMKLRRLTSPRLGAEWERRLDDFRRRGWRNHVELVGEPAIEYVGLSRSGAQSQVTVRIEAKLKDYVTDATGRHLKRTGRLSETVSTREFWTLGRQNNRWIVLSIEQGAEGSHALEEQIVPTAWADENALRDEALVEQAAADATPQGTDIGELADVHLDGNARAAALDLSLVDGRFAPDIIEVSARRAVSAWAQAIDGDDSALRSLASSEVVRALLHPGDPSGTTRVVLRGPEITNIEISRLRPHASPPTMTVEVEVKGRRYLEDRATAAVVAGTPNRVSKFVEHWTFALTGHDSQPWRIVAVDEPVTAG